MHSRRAGLVLVGLAAATTTAVTVPAAAATHDASSRLVTAVVVARPGAALPIAVPGGRVLHVFGHVGSELVKAPAASLTALAADPRVAGVSTNSRGRMAGNDYAGKSAGVFAADRLGGAAGKAGTGQGVNVALLDTGVSDTPALNRASGRITDGVDVSDLTSAGDASTSGAFTDGYGHGTFLASLIAGGKAPGSGGHALGVAPAARIVVVKVANDAGETSLAQVLAGMDWVAANAQAPNGDQMIQVLNLALAIDRPTAPAYGADPLTAAVDHVRAAGVLVVAAVGNTPGEVGDPGMAPQALTVGAADITDNSPDVASFSGSGVVAGVAKPDVVASGVRLLGLVPPQSAIAQDSPSGWQANGLFRGSGTSEATAVTAGVAAAWFSDHPGAGPTVAKAALRAAADDSVGHGPKVGSGLVQLATGNGDVNGSPKAKARNLGESGFDAQAWQDNAWSDPAWQGTGWESWLASSWSASSWSASSWSASSWSASSWSASSWSASSWSASSWSASSWSASSWSASSWSASSWSDYGWGDAA